MAEDICTELPDGYTDFRSFEDRAIDNSIDQAFDELGEYGGFVRVAISAQYQKSVDMQAADAPVAGFDNYNIPSFSLTGTAEFYVFEDEIEFTTIQHLLKEGDVSPTDIIAHIRFNNLGSLLTD